MIRPSSAAPLVWVTFFLAHVLVAVLGWVLPSQPMGDVVLVYLPWSTSALEGTAVVGITEPWVYPQVALVPMLLAHLPAALFEAALGVEAAYLIGWAVLVTACDLLAFAVLVGRGRRPKQLIAGGFWAGAIALLGPVGMYRIDAIVVPLALVGALRLIRRPAVAAVLLMLGAWMKIWPGALLVAAVVAVRSRARIVAASVSTLVAIMGILILLGASGQLLGFLGEQTGRGLQVEAGTGQGLSR